MAVVIYLFCTLLAKSTSLGKRTSRALLEVHFKRVTEHYIFSLFFRLGHSLL